MGNDRNPVERAIQKAIDEGKVKPGQIHLLHDMHDDWCDFLNRKGECNCDPIVKLDVQFDPERN